MNITDQLKAAFAGRPHWMNAIMVFCAYMTFIYMPFDLFYKPVAEDQEVFFGYMFTGWAAKATAPIHWLIYGAGFYGFLKMKSWMHPWAALYTFQVAIGMAVWGWLYGGASALLASVFALPFVALGVAIWRAKERFNGAAPAALSDTDQSQEKQENTDG